MYKKRKVVMLATNEKAPIVKMDMKEQPNVVLRDYNLDTDYGKNDTYQHLYILSDEKIEEGDWCVNKNLDTLYQMKDIHKEYNPNDDWYKVIAATDTSLSGIEPAKFVSASGHYQISVFWVEWKENKLPQPSQPFIQKYVEEYNKGNIISDVMVEYEDNFKEKTRINNLLHPDASDDYNIPPILKIDSDNTITIRKVKISFNNKEIDILIDKAIELGCSKEIINWKNENLY